MDSGKENDNDDFQTVIRHARRKSSHERDRGPRRQMFQSQDSRGRRHGERDRDRQYHHQNQQRQGQGHGISSHAQKEQPHQQQAPTVQSSLTNGTTSGGSFVNSVTVKRSSGGVTNGSICSESGSSSLGTTESIVHSSTNSNGLLEGETESNNVNHNESVCNGLPDHIRHLSGGSLSGSASTCETDNVHHQADIAQNPDESSNKSQFIVAPPPAVNPWRSNPNAASIIAKKTPASHQSQQNNLIPIRPNSLVSRPPLQTAQKKPVTGMNGEKRTEKDKTKGTSTTTTTQLTNNTTSGNSQKENEFKTVTRSPQRRSFRDRGRRMFQPGEGRGRRQGERDRDKQLPHAIPSQQQPPTTTSTNSAINNTNTTAAISSTNNGTSSNCPNGLSVRSNGVVKNGSICSESGSSSLGTPESLVHTNSNCLLEVSNPLVNHANNNGVPDHIRHSSGESLSGSASSLETELVHDIAQIQESEKPQFVVAPPPKVNPWRVNLNAASIIAKKTPASQIQPLPIPQTSVAPQISQKKPVTTAVIGEKGPDKDKTTSNTNLTSTTAQSTNSSANSQTVEQSSASTTKTQTLPKSTNELSQQSQRKDIQEQVLKPRRAFAAVTRNHRGGFVKDLKSGARNSQEDWPTLQEALVSPTTSTPTVALSKSVIAMAHESGKMTRRTSTEESATDSEAMTLQQRKQKLPSDKWPSISDDVVEIKDAKTSHSHTLIHNNSDMVNDDTPSEASNSGDANEQRSTKKLQNGTNQGISENGSLSSSDDNEHGLIENELDADASTGTVRKGKKSKQKWVPLSLPETPSSKSRVRRDRSSAEREWEKEKDPSSKPKAKVQSNKDDGLTNIEGRSNHTYVARGRGRNNGIRGRGGRGRGGNQHWSYRDGSDLNEFSSDADYTDYPADYTTLPAMYPVTEFIMPYMTNGYYPATYTPPPPAGAVADDAQNPAAYVPVDETVLNDMVKKQIEYYFSEENLEKDFYLRRKMDEDGFLPVNFIATFPRIKNMTQDYNMVVQAIQASPDLELKEDLSCLRTIHEPTKWPILDETSVGLTMPQMKMTAPPVTMIAYPTPNGFVTLSGISPSTFQSPSITEKLNPNVPEFVPKAKIVGIV